MDAALVTFARLFLVLNVYQSGFLKRRRRRREVRIRRKERERRKRSKKKKRETREERKGERLSTSFYI